MDAPNQIRPTAGLSDYLAAERTLLAWIRTGLALMGFGFVVARFGLFLQQLRSMQRASAAQPYGLSLWFGTALIAGGVIVTVCAGWHHLRLVRDLESQRNGTFSFFHAACRDCFLFGLGRADNGDLSCLGPKSHKFAVYKR